MCWSVVGVVVVLEQVESLKLACTAETQTDIGAGAATHWEDQIDV